METKIVFLSLLISYGSCSVIIPEELPSLLSVAYSNIPPIKKGTDSRIGFGYAFGNHADFQIMLELGPQTNTNAIGQPFGTNTNKRQASLPPTVKVNKNRQKFMESDAGKYLQRWYENMKNPQKIAKPKPVPGEVGNLEDSMVELVKNNKGEYEIHQPKPAHMPAKVLDDLKRLYGQKKEEAKKIGEKKRTPEEVDQITADLSNVELQ